MSNSKDRKTDRRSARPTIGYLAGVVWTRETRALYHIWRGVTDGARERGANLLCFVGGLLGSSIDTAESTSRRNVLYDFATSDTVDGLVIGVLGLAVSVEEFQAFCDRYRSLPMVNIATALKDIPSVLVDNVTGLRHAVSHLIEVHGRRRIAFIRGPEGFEEAEARYRAYTEALAEHGLAFNPDLLALGDHFTPSGAAAMRMLMDERKLQPGVDFDAVVAGTDAMGLGALDVLRTRGVQVPYDVALVGFDDVAEARVATPALTTVRYPLHEQGKRAVEMLLAMLAGEDVPEEVTLPAETVVRQSCGCHSQAVLQAAVEPAARAKVFRGRWAGETLGEALAARRDEIVGAMVQGVADYAGEAAPAMTAEWAKQLLDGFEAAMEDSSPEGFLSTLDQVLRQVVASGDLADSAQRVAAWQGAFSALRGEVLPRLAGGEALARAENLWQQARMFITEAVQQAERYRQLQAEQQTAVLQAVGQAVMTSADIADLMDVIARELPRLGIPSACLSLYEGQEMPPQECRLILAYGEDGRIELQPGGQCFPSRELVPGGMLPQERCYSMVVEALYFRDHQLGFALFEAGPRGGAVYEVLQGQISGALQAALLTQQVRHRALQLQTAAEVSQAASSILDPDELIHQVVNLVHERFNLYYAGLFLVDRPGEWAVLRAGTGEAGQQMVAQGHRLEVGGESMIGRCVANNQARIALDVGEEAVRFDNPLLPETRSELALPLVSRGEAIGALTIQSAQEAAFGTEDIAVLQTMADQLANAIQNVRLFDEQQSTSFLLGERVRDLDFLNEIGREMDESPSVPDLLRWVAERLPSAMRFSDECVVAVELEGRVHGASEAIDLPCQMVGGLRIGGERIGQVTVAYTEEHAFRDEESALIGDVVRRLSGYVERSRLLERTQNALREAEATHRRYMEQAWTEYARSAGVTAYEIDPLGGEPLGDALLPEVQQVVEQQRVMTWTGNDGEADHSALVAPLVLRGMVIGALGIHDEGARQWTEEEIALIEAVSERVALAVESMRLLDETQRRAAREQLIGEVTGRVRETLDMETVLKVAVQELRQSLGLPEVVIRLAPGKREER